MHQSFSHYQKLAAEIESNGLYHSDDEHDACGVGMVASIDGSPRRDVVRLAIEALKAVWHRGAVNGDGKTGDGAGVHIQIPDAYFREYIASFGKPLADNERFAVGMVFLPRQQYDDRSGNLPRDSGARDYPLWLPYSWLEAGECESGGHW